MLAEASRFVGRTISGSDVNTACKMHAFRTSADKSQTKGWRSRQFRDLILALLATAEQFSSTRSESAMKACRGFTLVELMVVVAIMAILLSIAAPSFTAVVNQNRLAGAANELVAGIQLARQEAHRRGQRTVICRSANANDNNPVCTTATADWEGWIAFVDSRGAAAGSAPDGTRQSDETVLARYVVPASIEMRPSAAVTGASNRITFRADGTARADNGSLLAATIGLCIETTRPADNARDVVIRSGSNTSIAPRNGAGACSAPSNPS